jgi:hypothetical protein
MRDLVAVVVVVVLVVFALSMATSLQWYRRSHAKSRRSVQSRGQSILAEIPASEGLRFFTEDAEAFHWMDRTIPKHEIRAARVLISGAPISVCASTRFSESSPRDAVDLDIDSTTDGFGRDRWDVAIDLQDETVLVECGAIRERVSQELARQVFDAVRRDIETRESDPSTHHSRSATPVR